MEKRPLPERRSKIILLIRVRDKRVVGSHHSHVEMDEVLPEWRLVIARITSRQSLVDVAFNVPMSVHIARVVCLDTGSLNLLETPLRKVDVTGAKVTSKIYVLQSDGGGKSSKSRAIVRSSVTDNLDFPVILGVSNAGVAITRDLPIGFRNRGSDLVRM
jgi:hypothetical protein